MTDTRNYTVAGMTCSHCADSVTEEVGELTGVACVEVDLDTGRLTVTGTPDATPDDAAVEAAVAEAVYAVVRP